MRVTERPDPEEPGPRAEALGREYRALVEEIMDARGRGAQVVAFLRGIDHPGRLADTAGYSPEIPFEKKVELLETLDVVERLEKAIAAQRDRLADAALRRRIRDEVDEGMEKTQREFLLRRQLEAIRKELGEDDESGSVEDWRRRIDEAEMPEGARREAERELGRLERQPEGPEAGMIRTYLEWMVSLPWNTRSDERLEVAEAREQLDADHAGLEKVKERILEYLAVRKLRRDREMDEGSSTGVILTLVGPPGTGKTSLGQSIAKAMGREFVRMSLGGIRDEAEIRGHRRTYVGALPGRLVRALRDAGTRNPVIMLDEVDKVGADWRGDPSSALLEVLDPAQNHSFRDHYLDVELDLSEVLFIATANVVDTIPGPLLDRMEVITLDGYTEDEKVAIARGYLIPRQTERNGLREGEVVITEAATRAVVEDYTREAGVRSLERELSRLLRKAATRVAEGAETPITVEPADLRAALGRQKFHHEAAERTATPGVATGLAVTGAGGDVLFVEATAMPADGQGERLVVTGQLGDVMRESSRIALSWVRSHADELGGDPESLTDRQVHVHVPAGAVPKDGPSAGVTMVTALTSLITGRAVHPHVGMTGRGHAPGPGPAHRRAQAEGARRPPGRADGRDHPGAQPGRPGRRARGRAGGGPLPPGPDRGGGPGRGPGAGATSPGEPAGVGGGPWDGIAASAPSSASATSVRPSSSAAAGARRSSAPPWRGRCASPRSAPPCPGSPPGSWPSACASSRPPGSWSGGSRPARRRSPSTG